MSLKEFLHEERLNRKQMRLERKKNKKQPLTKSQKVHKVVSIIFVIAVIIGAFAFAFSGVGKYDYSKINDLPQEIVDYINEPIDESLIFDGKIKLSSADLTNCKTTLNSVGLSFDDDESSNTTPTSDFELSSREIGALSQSLIYEISKSNKLEINYFEIFFDITKNCIYETSIVKVNLRDYFSGSKLPQIYVVSTSVLEVHVNTLEAISFESYVNNFDKTISSQIFESLNKKSILTKFDELTNKSINSSINTFNALLNTKMALANDKICFGLKSDF